jgi:hypothetical protein
VLFGPRQELRRRDLQGLSKSLEVRVADVALAALDAAQIRAVHPAEVREVLLRDAARTAQVADRAPERGVQLRTSRHRVGTLFGRHLSVYTL